MITCITNILLNAPTKNGRSYNAEAIEQIILLIKEGVLNRAQIPVLLEEPKDNAVRLERMFGMVSCGVVIHDCLHLTVEDFGSEIARASVEYAAMYRKMIRVGSLLQASVCDDETLCKMNGWVKGTIYGVAAVPCFYIEDPANWLQLPVPEPT